MLVVNVTLVGVAGALLVFKLLGFGSVTDSAGREVLTADVVGVLVRGREKFGNEVFVEVGRGVMFERDEVLICKVFLSCPSERL